MALAKNRQPQLIARLMVLDLLHERAGSINRLPINCHNYIGIGWVLALYVICQRTARDTLAN
jgi:hypothetical protein